MTVTPPNHIVPAAIIKTYAESVGINNLSEDVLTAIAQEVEYRARELVQDASKYARHEHRDKLMVDDLNYALKARNLEPQYGYDSVDSLAFRAVPNTAGLFYVPNEELDVDDMLKQPPPAIPPPVTLTYHWLCIDGVQPAIPENPTPADKKSEETISLPATRREMTEDVEIRALARHSLSKELQLLYDAIIEALFSNDQGRIKAALQSVTEDAGVQPLLPYFVQCATETVAKNLDNEERQYIALELIKALLTNRHIFIEPYLHQLMPPILTCLIGKLPTLRIRYQAAVVLHMLCNTYGDIYHTLIPRVCKTLVSALDGEGEKSKAGGIIGLIALGGHAIETLLVPKAIDLIYEEELRTLLEEAVPVWEPHCTNPDAFADFKALLSSMHSE